MKNIFDSERARGHRIAGPMLQHQEERHWILAAVGIAVAVIGAGVSAYAASEQAAASRAAAKAQTKQLEQQAQSEREQAEFEERQFRKRIRRLKGKQIAESASLGIDIAGGSPLLLELDTATEAELEALNIRRAGARAASATEFEASLAKRRAGLARREGLTGIGGAAVGGAGSILRTFVQFQSGSQAQTITAQNQASGGGIF